MEECSRKYLILLTNNAIESNERIMLVCAKRKALKMNDFINKMEILLRIKLCCFPLWYLIINEIFDGRPYSFCQIKKAEPCPWFFTKQLRKVNFEAGLSFFGKKIPTKDPYDRKNWCPIGKIPWKFEDFNSNMQKIITNPISKRAFL